MVFDGLRHVNEIKGIFVLVEERKKKKTKIRKRRSVNRQV